MILYNTHYVKRTEKKQSNYSRPKTTPKNSQNMKTKRRNGDGTP